MLVVVSMHTSALHVGFQEVQCLQSHTGLTDTIQLWAFLSGDFSIRSIISL